ncbi:metallophosphoesterase [Sorangium sp. So ce233]
MKGFDRVHGVLVRVMARLLRRFTETSEPPALPRHRRRLFFRSAAAVRIAAVSDIHGNLAALEAVLADIARRGADVTVNLGDILSGPLQPHETDREKI